MPEEVVVCKRMQRRRRMARNKREAKGPPASGGARLRASGKKAVLLGLTQDQYDDIFAAAKIDGRYATQFLTHYGLAAAKKILGKMSKIA
jgi:hypothetical protein